MGPADPGQPPTGTASRHEPDARDGRDMATVRPRPGPRVMLGVLLVAAVAAGAFGVGADRVAVGGDELGRAARLLGSLLQPDLSARLWLSTLPSALGLTLAYAVAGTSVALAIGLPGALLVSGTLARRRATRLPALVAGRGTFAVLRGYHELVWAVVLVAILSPHPLAGILAIGVPYGATIARVLGERLQDVPAEPLAALRSAGASPLQLLAYGRVPSALSDIVAYVLYRFECSVRAAAVLGVVGLGGLGAEMQHALLDFRLERVGPLLAALVLAIVVIDWGSGRVRARVVT